MVCDVYTLLRPCEPSRISSDDTAEIGGENTAKVKITGSMFTESHKTSKGRGVASAEVLSFYLPISRGRLPVVAQIIRTVWKFIRKTSQKKNFSKKSDEFVISVAGFKLHLKLSEHCVVTL